VNLALRLNGEFRIVNCELAAQHILCYKSYNPTKANLPCFPSFPWFKMNPRPKKNPVNPVKKIMCILSSAAGNNPDKKT
jgi:hypothetical protein